MNATLTRPAITPCLKRIPAAQYHADEIGEDRPALSASIASVLVRQTPYHAWLRHPKMGGVRSEVSAEMNKGTLVHALVLGSGMDQIQVIACDNYRTKAAQEQRDTAIAHGLTPILELEMDVASKASIEIARQIASAGFGLRPADSEHVAVWEEESEYGSVLCRGMIDNFNADAGVILDLKNCRSAHPKACASHVEEYGADVQRAAYLSAVERIHPDLAGRVDYVWLMIEWPADDRPLVAIRRADGMMAAIGAAKWKRAVATWGQCLASGQWPAYPPVRLEPPKWAMAAEESL